MPIRYFDMFAGIGGFRSGLKADYFVIPNNQYRSTFNISENPSNS